MEKAIRFIIDEEIDMTIKDSSKRKYFDKEYQTTYLREVEYLNSVEVFPCFAKKVEDTIIYKFTKTKKLFEELSKFYAI